MIRFSQLQSIAKGDIIALTQDRNIKSIITDSRKAIVSEESVFFAMRGKHHNGHEYIEQLYRAGIRQFVVESVDERIRSLKDCNIFTTDSSLDVLQNVAAYHRSQFDIPVIGITGSNAKTIIKEWLFQLLSEDVKVVKNPGSYNSQLGVPLSVLLIESHHQLGIFEAGISSANEMDKLQKVIRPTIGLFTNIGSAHNEGFKSVDEKIDEKLKLFKDANVVIYCWDHALIREKISSSTIKELSWGFNEKADLAVKRISNNEYRVSRLDKVFRVTLPFDDKASVENALHCVAVMVHLGYSEDKINLRLSSLRSVPMRLELKEGINQCLVIDDAYNNDLAGLQISLDFLSNQRQRTSKRLILSDILESGLSTKDLVEKIADLVNKSSIENFIGVGGQWEPHHHLFKMKSEFFSNTESLLKGLDWDAIRQEVILVKGARKFQFEKIVQRLQRKLHGTVMEINLGAVVNNLNFFKSKLKPSTKIMVMVKAFAYGSGSNEIANLLQFHKADYLGVAYADEGVELRKNNISIPIMVMNPSEESFATIENNQLEPEIYSFNIFSKYISFLSGRPGKIHLKIDTGMHRLGFESKDINELTQLLKAHQNIKVASIFSHLAGADEAAHDHFSKEQALKFKESADHISNVLGYRPLYHILNSPGILRLSEFQFDMVRLGIGLYGINPTNEKIEGLQPVATLKTIISQIKQIRRGESIGYGRKGLAEKEVTIATIAIGYADGFSRAFSRGTGEVLVSGKKAKVIGNVCMDMTMINITGIEAKEGDEVVIFGPELPIHELAEKINTIPYEILTNTSERVKRVFVAESI
jgi:Alr-MurF fusion protein